MRGFVLKIYSYRRHSGTGEHESMKAFSPRCCADESARCCVNYNEDTPILIEISSAVIPEIKLPLRSGFV